MKLEDLEDIFELSPMQQGMLFHSLYSPSSAAYFEQTSSIIRGPLDISAFKDAWQHVIQRHGVLRTSFNWEELQKPHQLVYKKVGAPITVLDWSDLSSGRQDAKLEAFLQQDRDAGFDLSRCPLLRLTLIRMSGKLHQLVWSNHHAILDGWSRILIINDLLELYAASVEGRQARVTPVRPYRDYISWLKEQDASRAEAYWREALGGFNSPTYLGEDQGNLFDLEDANSGYRHREIRFSVELTERVKAFAKTQRLTLNTLMYGAWALIVARETCRRDVVFGGTLSGRPAELKGVEQMVGLFINTLPVRVRITPGMKVVDWLSEIQIQQAEMRQYQHSSLADVQRWSEIPRGLALFDSVLVFENFPGSLTESGNAERLIEEVGAFDRTNYPLIIGAGLSDRIWARIDYDLRLFEEATVSRIFAGLETLLSQIAGGGAGTVTNLSPLDRAERRRIVEDWNATRKEFPNRKCIHARIEQQAARTPDAPAVVFEDHVIRYETLNERANQMAHRLRDLGVGPDVLVGLCLPPSIELVIGLLATLKSGGAYVGMAPDYPAQRLAYLVEDSRAGFVLTKRESAGLFEKLDVTLVYVDAESEEEGSGESTDNPAVDVAIESLAYVIYTSGSTGRPKGVLTEHRQLLHYIDSISERLGLREGGRYVVQQSIAVDAPVTYLFAGLSTGGEIHLISHDRTMDADWINLHISDHCIDYFKAAPSYLKTIQSISQTGFVNPNSVLLIGGEALDWSQAAVLAESDQHCRFVNHYGPTETTVGATTFDVPQNPARIKSRTAPIGRPLMNVQMYILDADANPLSAGVVGEIYIGGGGLTRGYLHRPELTAERFVPDSLSSEGGARLYRTGDLGRFLEDGNIEFTGRTDNQTKIRGYRVELEEIEAVIKEHPCVQSAVVSVSEAGGDRQLAAYVVSLSQEDFSVAELRSFLAEKLPEHMRPAMIITLDSMPLTRQGKVDRQSLPTPDRARPDIAGTYVPPRDMLEFSLARIWEQVLDIHPVGVRDSFFDLGGYSFSAMRLVFRIREELGRQVAIATLFEEQTIERLAIALRQSDFRIQPVSVVPLQAKGSMRPFFCVHPFGGGVICYSPLANHFADDRPFYGLQAPGLDDEREPLSDMAALASNHIEAMRSIQPEGPYLIGGWSFGGKVAFETAQQLRAQGEEVSLLALIDAEPVYSREVDADYITEAGDQAIFLMGLFRKALPISFERLSGLDSEGQLLYMIQVAKDARLLPPDFGLPEAKRWLELLFAHRTAGLNYTPEPYSGPVTLLKAAEGLPEENTDPTDGWAEFVTGELRVRMVPGDHRSMMSESNVAGLAQALMACIDEANQDSSAMTPPSLELLAIS